MTSELPSVTIITGYHNRENFVDESIQSLLDQTYSNFKVVIFDDNSTDKTFEKLKKFADNDDRIILIKNKTNKGFTRSLIDVINDLDSEFIAIHGSGDISLPLRIRTQVDYLQNNLSVGVVAVDVINSKNHINNIQTIHSNDLLKKNSIAHGAVMFRKTIYNKVGGYRDFFIYRQDFDLWSRMSIITEIHKLPEKLYKISIVKNSVSQDVNNSIIPTLQSLFAHQMLKERLKTGVDSIDRYGPQAGLIFDPSKCNSLLFRKMFYSLKIRQYKHAEIYSKHLVILNSNSLRKPLFQFINFTLRSFLRIVK